MQWMTMGWVFWASEGANVSAVSNRGRNATSVCCLGELQLSTALGVCGLSQANCVQRLLGLVVLLGPSVGGLKNSFSGPEKVWGWVLSAFLGLHGDGSGEGTGFGSGRALFPLPPLHHLLHPHTWPGAAAAASAPRQEILPPQGGACARLCGLLLPQTRESRPQLPPPSDSGVRPLVPSSLGIRGSLKHRQNCET